MAKAREEGENINRGICTYKMVGRQLGKRIVCWKHVGTDVQSCNDYVNEFSSSVF